MLVKTTRFGDVPIEPVDIINFSQGIIGLSDCRAWVILADEANDALAWLQSVDRPEIAMAVVCPRRFVPSYQIRIGRLELTPLKMSEPREAHVLVAVGKHQGHITLNLKAPLLLNIEDNLGCQVVNRAEFEVQHILTHTADNLRRSA